MGEEASSVQFKDRRHFWKGAPILTPYQGLGTLQSKTARCSSTGNSAAAANVGGCSIHGSCPSAGASGEIVVRPKEDQQENQEAGRRSQERTDVLGSHDETFALLSPRVALLIRGVD